MAGGWSRRASHEVAADRVRAASLSFLTEGRGQTLAQAALRFALMKPQTSTVLVGFSDLEQVETAAGCYAGKGILPEDLHRLAEFYHAD